MSRKKWTVTNKTYGAEVKERILLASVKALKDGPCLGDIKTQWLHI